MRLVRDVSTELLSLLRGLHFAAARSPVLVQLVDRRGAEVFVGRLELADLVRLRAEEQVPGHARSLGRLVDTARGG